MIKKKISKETLLFYRHFIKSLSKLQDQQIKMSIKHKLK